MVDRFVTPKKRPTWKQGPLGLFGRKMTLETSPAYIKEHNAQLSTLREKEDSYELGNTAFVRFSSQQEAHAFARLASSTNKQFNKVKVGIELIPEDIQWSNIKMSPSQRAIRTIISWALTIGLIIVWAVPVAFVGLVSNVDTLCTTAPFLAWICKLPRLVFCLFCRYSRSRTMPDNRLVLLWVSSRVFYLQSCLLFCSCFSLSSSG